MKSQLAQAQEEKEQNSQVLTYKLEQIAMMEEKMKEVEAKLAEVTAEVEARKKEEERKREEAKLKEKKKKTLGRRIQESDSSEEAL